MRRGVVGERSVHKMARIAVRMVRASMFSLNARIFAILAFRVVVSGSEA